MRRPGHVVQDVTNCYLYGIRSERRLIEEIRVNIAYRWFIGLSLTDPVPPHSIFSQNRRRRFQQSEIYQEIFDEIVLQSIPRVRQ
ncbi:transposase [Geobacillus sp. 44B]|nr:transposase [Geobacillus sp. 44B]